jgi:flagellar L-ring protein precursor FlgH
MQRSRLLLLGAGVLVMAGVVRADSIWDRRDPRSAYLFVDNRARQVGDLLTIVVREATDIDNKEKRALDKKTASGGIFKYNTQATDGAGTHAASLDFDASGSSTRSFDGKSEFSSQRELADRMTVTVIDVLPNGNLLIEGLRRRVVSGDERLLRVSGIVRPIDIGPGNIVESQFIANFQLAYDSKGAESKFTNQGWLNRVVNHVWPF